jgi:hypothetical protein
VKVTSITQLLPATRVAGEAGHVLVWAKSATFVPTTEILLSVIPAFPRFLNVIVCAALGVPMAWLAKVSVEGDKLAIGPPATLVPVPTSATVWAPGLELSETIAKALSALAVEGLNVKLIVQMLPGARILGDVGQLFIWVKSPLLVPVTAMLVILSPAFPVFVIVNV